MKITKNTIEGVELNTERRSGNSTRQINSAIDNLFKGFIVEVKDHWENGNHRKANEMLFRRILDRLHFEHQLDLLIKQNLIKINKKELTLEVKITHYA